MTSNAARRAVAIIALGLASTAGVLAPATVASAAASRAVVVVDNSTHTITFNGTISGLQALQLAVGAANVETIGYGPGQAVCRINGVGNPPAAGQCLGETTGQYWSYWKSPPGSSSWQYSGSGAGTSTVSDGGVEGWHFGTTQSPPYHSFCEVAGCGPPEPVTTIPTVAPAGGPDDGSGSTTGATPGASTKGGSTKGGGTTASTIGGSNPAASSTTSTTGERAAGDGEQASGPRVQGGRPDIEADDRGDSPVGVVIGGAVVVALGGTGMWIRRRRRMPS